jgi:NAD(P)H-hydrate repair Nnr-like enzyme with NAD(P)H-hydrate epimerase domain
VPAVTAEQMQEADRIAVEEFGLSILQMMGNAGRNLALHAIDMLGGEKGPVTILAGSGGNGGATLSSRHIHAPRPSTSRSGHPSPSCLERNAGWAWKLLEEGMIVYSATFPWRA